MGKTASRQALSKLSRRAIANHWPGVWMFNRLIPGILACVGLRSDFTFQPPLGI